MIDGDNNSNKNNFINHFEIISWPSEAECMKSKMGLILWSLGDKKE